MHSDTTSQIQRLQEECHRLEFENRRLRRTLRCVDCSSRIESAPKEETAGAFEGPESGAQMTQDLPWPGTTDPLSCPAQEAVARAPVPAGNVESHDGLMFTDYVPWQSLLFGDTERTECLAHLDSPTRNSSNRFDSSPLPISLFPPWDGHDSASVGTSILTQGVGIYASEDEMALDEQSEQYGDAQMDTFMHSDLLSMSRGPTSPHISSAPLPNFGASASISILDVAGLELGFKPRQTQQRMETYIKALGTAIRDTFGRESKPSMGLEALVSHGVLWIVREAWPSAEGFWKLSASLTGFVQSELWRLFPCRESYEKLHPSYRPTVLQLTTPHSPLIDWLPWPDLRDRIIQFQDQLDVEAVCKTAIQNTMAHRQLPGSNREHCNLPSFRIWDLYMVEKQSGLALTNNQLSYNPRSPTVIAMQRTYGLIYDDLATQKLHPAFFERYPILACERLKTCFTPQEIPKVQLEDVGFPKPFTEKAMIQLKQLATKRVHTRTFES